MKNLKKLQKNSGVFFRFLPYVSPILRKESKLLTTSLLALLAEVILKILQPWPLKFVIDSFFSTETLDGPSIFQAIESLDNTTLIILSAIAFVLIVGLRAVAMYYKKVGFAKVGIRVFTKVRNMVFRHIQILSLSFHSKARSGDLVIRVIHDIAQLKNMSISAFLPLLGTSLVFVGIIGVMFWMNWQLALLTLTIIPLFFLFSARKGKKIRKFARQQRKREGKMATTAAESIVAIKEIQALSLKDTFFNKFSNDSNKSLKQEVKIKKEEGGLVGWINVLIGVATALVLAFGALLVLDNKLTPGDLVVFLFYVSMAFKPLRKFASYLARLLKASASCERVLEILEKKPDVSDLPDAIEAASFRGEVRFENVSFSYKDGPQILENIDLTIPPGTKVAIVGPSGIGKSTLVSLILRLYDCNKGRVIIDGHDIREYKLDSLRRQINVVQQDNMLFGVSVAENISYGASVEENTSIKEPTQKEIESAARSANAHEFIKLLPNGYETILGERGITLSKGQRQRIAVARAALRKTPILILDEPTTGLDEENEHLIIETMEKLQQGCTTFLATHNLKQAARSDLILYLEKGNVVESGSQAELMQVNGRYASLFKQQVILDNK